MLNLLFAMRTEGFKGGLVRERGLTEEAQNSISSPLRRTSEGVKSFFLYQMWGAERRKKMTILGTKIVIYYC